MTVVDELEIVLEGEWTDDEVAELEALAEVLDPGDDFEAFVRVHDLLGRARRRREERLDDLSHELDLIGELEGSAVSAVVGGAEQEFLRGVVDYGLAVVRAARLRAAHDRMRGRIAAARKIHAALLRDGRTDQARRVAKLIAGAKSRLRAPSNAESELAHHQGRVQVLHDRLEARAGADPEREQAMAKWRKAERTLERAKADERHRRGAESDTAPA